MYGSTAPECIGSMRAPLHLERVTIDNVRHILRRLLMPRFAQLAVLSLFLPTALLAQINSHSDGSDGTFNPLSSEVVDLSLAVDGDWETGNGGGDGVYDSTKWAVVFKYSSINIPSGVTVTFSNHPSGAPVVWLVDGGVTIDGVVNLNGMSGYGFSSPSEPGPGGFAGGAGRSIAAFGGPGMGPGGGGTLLGAGNGAGASYGTKGFSSSGSVPGAVYGSTRILPLLGGSGGGAQGAAYNNGGGGGGGALLLVAATTVSVDGSILANGGGHASTNAGGGSGGGVRIIADSLQGSGAIQAIGGTSNALDEIGGNGRIRLESNDITIADVTVNVTTYLTTLGPSDPMIWTDDDTLSAPTVRIDSIAGMAVSLDPNPSFLSPPADLNLSVTGPVSVVLFAENVPLVGSTVFVRMVPVSGVADTVHATHVTGPESGSTWSAIIDSIPSVGFAGIQASAILP